MNTPNNYRNSNHRDGTRSNQPRQNRPARPNPRREENDYADDYNQPDNYAERDPRYAQNERRNNNRVAERNTRSQAPRYNESYDDNGDEYYDDYADRRGNYAPPAKSNKPLLIGLGGLGAVALAAGIYALTHGGSTAQIISVSPNLVTTQQPYQDCHRVGTTNYVKNKKNGTEGAVIGGVTGAVAGGVIGNQVHGGGAGTAVGAVAGGVGGALIGSSIQKSNQPDYVAKHGSTTKCQTAYKAVQTQMGYNVQYMYKDNMVSIVTQTPPAIGSKIPIEQLQAMAVPAQQLNQNQQRLTQ